MLRARWLLLPAFFYFAEGLTFENVTIRGYNMFTEKFKKTIASSNHLKDNLPEQMFDMIAIKEQNIPILHEDSLADLGYLDELVIEDCGVKVIQPGALKNVPGLRRLSLKGNKLEEIESGVFNNLEISVLDLSKNSITSVDSAAFDDMTNLLNIQLADNRISNWDSNWFKNTPLLTRISMQNNLLDKIPSKAFNNLVGDKKYGNIDLTINLVFSHNKIETIDRAAFVGLKKINNLWLDNNLLRTFDEELLKNTEVDDLRIDHNNITCLDGDLSIILKANTSHIDSNPFDCKCLEAINNWKKTNDKTVEMFFSNMECSVQRIRSKINAINNRMKEVKHM